MNRVSIKLLFACLLLLSQSELVSHDVQHLGSAHNEFCAVYLFQDHSADSVTVSVVSIINLSPEGLQADLTDASISISALAYASRAPPKTLFFS